jgi:prepilin-type N-terminal cleavage/methylation domain-containing protein
MAPARSDRPRPDAGFTLVEVLVVCAVSSVVLAAIGLFAVTGLRHTSSAATRADALDRASFGLEQMSTELRQALELSPAVTGTQTTGVVDARRWTKSGASWVQRWFRYDCTAAGATAAERRCVRRDMTSGATTVLVDGLSATADPVFTLLPARAPALSGEVRIALAARVPHAQGPILLQSAVTPRTCNDGPPSGSTSCTG